MQEESPQPQLVLDKDKVHQLKDWFAQRNSYHKNGQAYWHPQWGEGLLHTLSTGEQIAVFPLWREEAVQYYDIGYVRRLVIKLDASGEAISANILEMVSSKAYLQANKDLIPVRFYEGTLQSSDALAWERSFEVEGGEKSSAGQPCGTTTLEMRYEGCNASLVEVTVGCSDGIRETVLSTGVNPACSEIAGDGGDGGGGDTSIPSPDYTGWPDFGWSGGSPGSGGDSGGNPSGNENPDPNSTVPIFEGGGVPSPVLDPGDNTIDKFSKQSLENNPKFEKADNSFFDDIVENDPLTENLPKWQRNIVRGRMFENAYKDFRNIERNWIEFSAPTIRTEKVRPDFVTEAVPFSFWNYLGWIDIYPQGQFIECKTSINTIDRNLSKKQLVAELEALANRINTDGETGRGKWHLIFVLVVPHGQAIEQALIDEATSRGIHFYVSESFLNIETGGIVFSTPESRNSIYNMRVLLPLNSANGVQLDVEAATPSAWLIDDINDENAHD